jgi:hypothetical protein
VLRVIRTTHLDIFGSDTLLPATTTGATPSSAPGVDTTQTPTAPSSATPGSAAK